METPSEPLRPRSGPVPTAPPLGAAEACSDCLQPFVRSAHPVSANPRARSYVLPDLCVRCSAAVLAKCDPPMTFVEMVRIALNNMPLVPGAAA